MKDTKQDDVPSGWLERTGGYARDMTLLDYFAIKALPLAIEHHPNASVEAFVKAAYVVADQMLKERAK